MSRPQKVAIAVFIAVYLAAATVGAAVLSGGFFLLANRKNPLQVRPTSIIAYWKAYHGDAIQASRLRWSVVISVTGLFVLAPMGIFFGTKKRRSLHGDARFATTAEVRQSGLLGKQGILIGKLKNAYLSFDGQQFVLLAAPTRSGKGVGVVVPNLLNWPDSVVVLDIKGENYELTASFRAQHGQKVFAFQPFEESGRTHRYNPLGYVRSDSMLRVGDLQTIGGAFYPTTADDDKGSDASKFWNEKARDFFVGLSLLVLETPELPKTLGEVLRQSSGKGKPVKEYLQEIIATRSRCAQPLTADCVAALDRFLSNPENTLGNVLSTFNAPLTIFADPLVDTATSDNDFDLDGLRRHRTSIYLVIPPPKLPVAGVLVNLFFSQLVALNTRTLPADDPTLKLQCLLLMDEFTSMGRVPILSKGVAYIAGYNLRLLTIVQSMSQLAGVYGQSDAKTFAENHALQILFAPKDQSSAKEASEWLGTYTEKAESVGRSRHIVGSSNVTSSRNISDQSRALMMPQELRELGKDREIVMLENTKPIVCEKLVYYTDPVLAPRVCPPPVVPRQDAALYRARLFNQVRPITKQEAESGVDLSLIAADMTPLQSITPGMSREEAAAMVAKTFSSMKLDDVPPAIREQEANGLREASTGNVVAMATPAPVRINIDLADLE